MSQSFKLLASYDNPVEANIVKGRLASAEIYCFLAGENLAVLHPYYSNVGGGIRLFVSHRDHEMAALILQKDLEVYRKNICCEVCRSNQVNLISTRRNTKNWIAFSISLFFGYFSIFVPPFYNKKMYICDVCGYETDNMD